MASKYAPERLWERVAFDVIPTLAEGDYWMSPEEVAKHLGVSKQAISMAFHRGRMQGYRRNREMWVAFSEVERYKNDRYSHNLELPGGVRPGRQVDTQSTPLEPTE